MKANFHFNEFMLCQLPFAIKTTKHRKWKHRTQKLRDSRKLATFKMEVENTAYQYRNLLGRILLLAKMMIIVNHDCHKYKYEYQKNSKWFVKLNYIFFKIIIIFLFSIIVKYFNGIFLLLGNFPSKIYFYVKVHEIK